MPPFFCLNILLKGNRPVKKHNPRIVHTIGILLSLGTLGLMLFFTHTFLYEAPYTGFYFNGTDGRIIEFYGGAASQDLLRPGDILKQVGDITLKEYQADGTLYFFKDVQPGETLPVIIERDGEEVETAWTLPGFSPEEFRARFINPWWLGYLFWGVGLAVQLFMRPRDARWRLLIAMNETTGVWFLLGIASSLRVWNSSILLHAFTWIALSIYLHLHWIFPSPLKRISSWVWTVLYLLCGALFICEIFQLLPRTAYYFGVLLMFGGSIVLLFLHLRQPQDRRAVQLLLLAFGVALLPAISLSLIGLGGRVPERGLVGMLALPLVPGAYAFLIIRQQSGGIEARASRFVSVYTFLILLGTTLAILSGRASANVSPVVTVIVTGLLAAYISIAAFPAFQSFINRRLLGIKLPYQSLLEAYSSRITTSASILALLRLLEEDVFPSLLVRRYAFLQLSGDALVPLLLRGVDTSKLPNRDELTELTSLAGRFLPLDEGHPHSWIRLILTLRAGDETLGLWLLGRRDPDDLYHAAEIPIFQSLADQTAIAMSNLLQAKRLRTLYQLDIDRHEEERHRLALELHDSVLNQLAVLRMNVDESNLSPNFQQAYEEVVQRLREIVSDLRPPMLNYGLKLALEELAQNLMERSGNQARVTLALWGGEERYPQNIEQHLFRIVQEACENAVRHAKATHVIISAQLDAQEIILDIQDNGVGFEMGERLELDDLLIRKHFGLAGIVERASLIGAKAHITSSLKTGTHIQVTWSRPTNQTGNGMME